MSANSLPELQAVAEVVADGQKKKAGRKRKVRKPLIIDKDLQRVSESIGAFSARQFGKVLSRAVSGAPDDSSAYAAAMNGMSLVMMCFNHNDKSRIAMSHEPNSIFPNFKNTIKCFWDHTSYV